VPRQVYAPIDWNSERAEFVGIQSKKQPRQLRDCLVENLHCYRCEVCASFLIVICVTGLYSGSRVLARLLLSPRSVVMEASPASDLSRLQEVLPKSGLVVSEKGQLIEVHAS
jgi:hypothetical protein